MQNLYLSIRKIAILAFLAAVSVALLSAQGAGSIRGTITDPSAASVPNADVHVTGNGQTRDAKTDSKGAYSVSLPAGQYTVRITAPGFVTTTKQGVAVSDGQSAAVDVELDIAAAAAQVDVTSSGRWSGGCGSVLKCERHCSHRD